MTLLECIRLIEEVASSQPSVNMIVENDVYKINSLADCRYGIFSFVQKPHSEELDADIISYKFSLFYIDRLIEDKSNQLEIQSTGVQTLSNILKTLREKEGIVAEDAVTYQPFNQRFADDCAGVFCDVSFEVLKDTLCGEGYQPKEVEIY